MIRSIVPAGIFAIAVGAWIYSGTMEDFKANAEETKPPAVLDADVERARVAIVPIKKRSFEDTLNFTGETRVDRKLDIQSEISGRIDKLMVTRGQKVTQGQIIARLGADDRPAALAEAKASLAQAEVDLEAKANLAKRGFGSEIEVRVAEANVERARASVLRAELAIENLDITAPFAGTIENTYIEPGAYVSPGSRIAQLLDKDPILVEGLAGERQIGDIKPGLVAQVELASGEAFEATVSYIAAIAEGDTRTFKIELEARNAGSAIPEGVSADISLPLGTVEAHFVPASVLALGPNEQIGIKTILEQGTLEDGAIAGSVEFLPAQIVSATSRGMWLSDLPDTFNLIVQGQNLVSLGETVEGVSLPDLEQRRLGLID